MKAKRFSEAQIVAILNQKQTGLTVIVRQNGISEATFTTGVCYELLIIIDQWMQLRGWK